MSKSRQIIIIILFLLIALPADAIEDSLRISDINVDIIEDEATISWRTNRAASSRVHYGETKDYNKFITTNVPNTTDHELLISELKPDTLYNFQVRSVDVFVNLAESNNFTFKTDKFEDDDTPIISNVKKPYITGSTATITWETDIKTTGKIKYGNDIGYGRSARSISFENGTKHQVTIRKLKPVSIYHFRVEAKTRKGEPARYQDITFKTTHFINPEKVNLLITKIEPADKKSINLTPNSATISWNTNKPATGYVRYGEGTRLRKKIKEEGIYTFNHSLTITDLKPGVDYIYKIVSKDVFRKSESTEMLSFTLPSGTPSEPIIVKGLSTRKINPPFSIVKTVYTDKIYGIIKGKKHHLSTPSVLNSYGFTFADVVTISKEVLDKHPRVTLIKIASSPIVYFTDENRKIIKRIPAEKIFLSYTQNAWGDIVTISHEDLQTYTETNLIKLPDDPTVYHINFVSGVRKKFIDEQSFLSRGYSFGNIITVNKTELNSFIDAGVLE